MDILTLSLGGPSGWLEGAAGVVASRIVDQGRVLTIAAGMALFLCLSLSSDMVDR